MYKINELPTPCFVIDEGKLEENLKILHQVEERTGAKILLAQKCFSCFSEYPLIRKYISGTTASGLYEARLGKEEMGLENHVYSPAYRPQDMEELAQICDHIIFNSEKQLRTYLPVLKASGTAKAGLRINPECSTQEGHAIYDPCAPGSRMGIRACDFTDELADLVDGLHFHTLCEQNSDDLETTLRAVEEKFGKWLFKMNWLNMGGGHHITREDYDIERLISCINHMKETYGLQIYLEPGEAFALNAGYNVTEVLDIVENNGKILILDTSAACHMPDVLEMPYRPPGEAVALNAGYNVTEVLDIVENNGKILILDTSAACHMPDVLEMPYRPPLKGSGLPGEKPYTYRLSCNTCLAGDVIGEYSFDSQIRIGDRLYFEDMAIYSMVKTNTFNGIPLPSIAVMDKAGNCRMIKEFGYEDFKNRLS